MHLNADELVDLAEGARAESSAPHLAACERCRGQLSELRAMMSAVADVDVPEPSPLFWDHLSQRVHDAVAAEAADARLKPSRSFLGAAFGALTALLGARAFQASVIAVALLVILVLSNSRVLSPTNPSQPVPLPAPSAVAVAEGARDLWSDAAAESDPSLTLVANLTASLDLDAAGEAGLAHGDTAEHAVTHMSDGELRELQRLLKEEIAHSGA